VFPNLHPGPYKLVLMRGTRWLSDDAVKKIYAGEVIFIGNLVFDEPHDPPYRNLRKNTSGSNMVDFHQCQPNDKFRIERDPQKEIDTLERTSSSFGDNYWTSKIEDRLAVLKQEVGD